MRLVLVRRVAVVKTIAASEQSFDTERACFTLPFGTGSLPSPLTLFRGSHLAAKGESMGVKTAQAIWSWRRSSQLERASISHPA